MAARLRWYLVSGKKKRRVIRLKPERPTESQKKLRHP